MDTAGVGVVPLASLEPLGRALLAHHRGRGPDVLTIRYDSGDEDEVPVAHFFRSEAELEPLERLALEACRGRVLDVGAGAGALALPLLARGLAVTALELLPPAAKVLRERGVRDVVVGDLWTTDPGGPFDTVLALMNGSGLAGTLARLPDLLLRLASFGSPEADILLDSADLRGVDPEDGRYPGEIQIQLEWGGRRGPPFPHLFVDPDTLAQVARPLGLRVEVVARGGDGRYLARLTGAVRPAGLERTGWHRRRTDRGGRPGPD